MKTRKQAHTTKKTRRKVIPLHIYQVWHDFKEMPSSVKESIQLLKEQNPEFEHHLYDEAMCREYIQKNFPKRVVQAFDKVVPYALKADIWRYCILYKKGGVYLDSKYYGINGFKLIQLTDKEYFCRDVKFAHYAIYNAFIICKPGNKKLLQSIKQFVKNTEEDYYGWTPGSVGPVMMKQFFTPKEMNDHVLSAKIISKKERFITLHGKRILKRHEGYSTYQSLNKNHWIKHWRERTLYHYQPVILKIQPPLFRNS